MLKSQILKNSYIVIKLLHNLDYLARDQSNNYYLLIPTQQQQLVIHFEDNSQLIPPVQTLDTLPGQKKSQNLYICYQLPMRSIWIGNVSKIKLKSQLFCISLLYNTISKIIKPLLNNYKEKSYKYLSIQNIWIKDHQCYLILKNRQQKQIINKLQLQQSIQKYLLKKLAQIFCKILNNNNQNQFIKNLQNSYLFLNQLLKSMLLKQLNIDQLDKILSQKNMRKKFIKKARQKLQYLIINPKKISRQKYQRYLFSRDKRYSKDNSLKHKINLQKNNNINYILPPSFQRKKKSFQLSQLINKSISIRNRYLSITTDLENKQQQNFGTPNYLKSQGYTGNTSYTTAPLKGQINHQKSILRHNQLIFSTKQKALKKYRDSIDIQQLGQKSIDDKQFRRCFQRKIRSSTLDLEIIPKKYQNQSKQEHNIGQQYQKNKVSQIIKLIQATQSINQKNKSKKQINQKEYFQSEKEILKKQKSNSITPQETIQNKTIQSQYKMEHKMYQEKSQNQDKIQYQNNHKKQQIKIQQKYHKQQKEKINNQQKQIKQKMNNKNSLPNITMKSQTNILNKNIQQNNIDYCQIPSVKLADRQNKQKQINGNNIIKQQKKLQKKQQQKNKPPLPKKLNKKINNNLDYHDDQIEQIRLDSIQYNKQIVKQSYKTIQQDSKINHYKSQTPKNQPYPNMERIQLKSPSQKGQGREDKLDKKIQKEKTQKSHENASQKLKTDQSQGKASSYGPKKPLRKQIDQYIMLVNKMGQSVAKSSRIAKKLQNIQWYTGIYFIYKRFFYQRRRIQKWIEQGTPRLSRYGPLNKQQWQQWLQKQQRQTILKKIKQDNKNIQQSISKMYKKISKKNLPGAVLFHSNLTRYSEQQSIFAVEYVVDQFDQIYQQKFSKKQLDEDIVSHLSDMINSLFIIAQLDEKIKQKKSIGQFNLKIRPDKMKQHIDYLYKLYCGQQ